MEGKGQYWLTRIVYIRALAFLYAVAFLVAWNQNEYLIGENGLTPAYLFTKRIAGTANIKQLMIQHPTLFWLIPPSTENLNIFSGIGLLISCFILLLGSANVPILLTLWCLYFSIINVGQTWYSFGWESQLLEIGFLTIFTVPFLSLKRFPPLTPTTFVGIWGNRWLLFRIMIGAGMIKIRGDQCWRDLTCMHFHYQTQPIPNPISVFFHNNFGAFHKFETFTNHVVELIAPFLLLIPLRYCQLIGGFIQLSFQMVLILSGNLAFLNWLTIVPAIMCFDDFSLKFLFSKSQVNFALKAEENYRAILTVQKIDNDDKEQKSKQQHFNKGRFLTLVIMYFRRFLTFSFSCLVIYKSYPVIQNIISPNQRMNVSFDSFRLVNSYGAFGSVTKIRNEVIIQGTNSTFLDDNTKWYDFEFPCKPGDINRRPCLISPYHLRLDWLLWFAAFQNYQYCPWIIHLADKLLNEKKEANSLLASGGNPFSSEAGKFDSKITFIRAELYEYQYASLFNIPEQEKKKLKLMGWEEGKFWRRKWVSNYFPPIQANNPSVQQFLVGNGLI